jgi:hypothetical protein
MIDNESVQLRKEFLKRTVFNLTFVSFLFGDQINQTIEFIDNTLRIQSIVDETIW